MTQHSKLRDRIDAGTYVDQQEMFAHLSKTAALDEADRTAISAKAVQLVRDIRGHSNPGLMEVFLAEYGLSTDEGVALMCLAEALLRVPDADTIEGRLAGIGKFNLHKCDMIKAQTDRINQGPVAGDDPLTFQSA